MTRKGQKVKGMTGLKVGDKVGKLTLIEKIPLNDGSRKWHWRCICDCDNKTERIHKSTTFEEGSEPSCGCTRWKRTGGRGKDSVKWKGIGEMPGRYYNNIKRNAKHGGYGIDITKEEIWAVWLEQEGKCALTGQQLTFHTRCAEHNGTASVDRIDSTKGYIKGNVHWVHKKFNVFKRATKLEDFVDMCRAVAYFYDNGKKYDYASQPF
jgi:hypothetical protein